MKKITFKPWVEGSDGIYDIFVNGKPLEAGGNKASVHISKEIVKDSEDDVTIYFPKEDGYFYIAAFRNPHDKEIIFSFARKYVRLFI